MGAREFPSFVYALPLTRRALEFAAAHHRGQRRDADAAAFILHPLEVAQLLRDRDYPDHVVAAGVLHDVIENTSATPAEIEQSFGPEIAGLVHSVTEPSDDGSFIERKARLRASMAGAGADAIAIYAADKVAKVRELRLTLARDQGAATESVTTAKLQHYWASLELLERRPERDPFVAQLRFELEALTMLPPRDAADLAATPQRAPR